MTPMHRALTAALACASVASCSPRTAPPQAQTQEPAPPPRVASAAPVDAGPRRPPAPPDPCPPLAPNEVSDDETPSIAGASKPTNAGAWLTARGVSKPAFRAWVKSRSPGNLEDFDADTLYDNDDSCQTLVVGDPKEDALVCTLAVRTSIMRYTANAFVVRNKRIVPVLEAGYAMPAMDWPDARWLDLQITFVPGGLEADVHDRARPGSVLVRPPSYCREHFARYLACEKAHEDGAPLDDVCPRTSDASGKMSFGHWSKTPPDSPMGGDRIELKGCAVAIPKLDELVKETGPKDMFRAEFRADRAFAQRSCDARGHYVWKDGRFVKGPASSKP